MNPPCWRDYRESKCSAWRGPWVWRSRLPAKRQSSTLSLSHRARGGALVGGNSGGHDTVLARALGGVGRRIGTLERVFERLAGSLNDDPGTEGHDDVPVR